MNPIKYSIQENLAIAFFTVLIHGGTIAFYATLPAVWTAWAYRLNFLTTYIKAASVVAGILYFEDVVRLTKWLFQDLGKSDYQL